MGVSEHPYSTRGNLHYVIHSHSICRKRWYECYGIGTRACGTHRALPSKTFVPEIVEKTCVGEITSTSSLLRFIKSGSEESENINNLIYDNPMTMPDNSNK